MCQLLGDHVISGIVDGALVLKPHLHLGGMDVDVDLIAVYGILKAYKRIFMLHHIGLVRFFNGFHKDLALDIASVDIIIFKIPVSSGHHRFSDKTINGDAAAFKMHFQQFPGNIPAVNPIDHIFQIGISRGMKPGLSVDHVFKGDVLVGQGKLLHIGADIACLRHGSL